MTETQPDVYAALADVRKVIDDGAARGRTRVSLPIADARALLDAVETAMRIYETMWRELAQYQPPH